MDDTPNSDNPQENSKNELTNETFEALHEGLRVLYIRRNQSGRIYFTKAHPELAAYILGQDLIDADTTGSGDNALRDQMEEEAEIRQFDLLNIFEELEERSAVSGVLQVEYVENVIRKLGREIALLIYTEKITNRFAPATAETHDKNEPAPAEAVKATRTIETASENKVEPTTKTEPAVISEPSSEIERDGEAVVETNVQATEPELSHAPTPAPTPDPTPAPAPVPAAPQPASVTGQVIIEDTPPVPDEESDPAPETIKTDH